MTTSNETPSQAEAQPVKKPNPWLSIWLKPRETIMHIVTSDPTRHVSLLAALSGIATTLGNAATRGFGIFYHVVSLLAIALIFGSIGGLLRLAFEGWLLSWVGNWLGGESTAEEMRAASAWSYLPIIVSLALYIPILSITGVNGFTSGLGSMLPLFFIAIAALLFMVGNIGFLWRSFILTSSIAELQGFSAGKAIANVLVAYAVDLIFVFLITIAIFIVT